MSSQVMQRIIRIWLSIAMAVSLNSCEPAFSQDIADETAIRVILGEAGQSDAERLAVAFALRNRGSLQGVYGYLEAPTGTQWQEGSMAWHKAIDGLETDITHGATHWLSDYDLKHCRLSLIAWRNKMVETAYIGNTHFYR